MTVANDALLLNLGLNGFPVVDNLLTAATTQNTATKCIGQVSRFTKVAASGTAVLPSVNSLEASGIVFVINDGVSTLSVWPQGLETIGGSNAAVTIGTGTSGIFIAVTAAKTGKGGGIAPGSFSNDWRFANIP
jgi:hypothetical protein